MKELIAFLTKLNCFTESEIIELASLLKVIEVSKNTVLIREGSFSSNCYFILKGCLRQYILKEGVDRTVAFYGEEEALNFYSATSNISPIAFNVVAVEDAIILVGNPTGDVAIFEKFPQLTPLIQKMVAADFGKTQDDYYTFMLSTPEERYLNLITNNASLIQRVPQRYIASFLGITPQSLSRMRARLKNKN